jgi:predicted phosphodiesterase
MRIAVISDIHANMEALTTVLADIDTVGAEEIICLGDIIGYGPEPEETVRLLRMRSIPSVKGNHEAGLVDPGTRDWFNPQSRVSLTLTEPLLSSESMEFLRGLPRYITRQGIRFVHGYPPNLVHTYLFEKTEEQLYLDMIGMAERVCCVGHTHELELVTVEGDRAVRRKLQQGFRSLLEFPRSLVNVGSVGQPRDMDRRAKYVLIDPQTLVVEVRCIDYDAQRTAAKIMERGMPRTYALRLLP